MAHDKEFKIRFGNVTVTTDKSSKLAESRNIKRGQIAMKKAAEVLSTPGVSLPRKKGVPRFFLDENDASIFIRRLDGKVDRGYFEAGEFKVK